MLPVSLILLLCWPPLLLASPCYEEGVEYHGGGLDNPMVDQVQGRGR